MGAYVYKETYTYEKRPIEGTNDNEKRFINMKTDLKIWRETCVFATIPMYTERNVNA